MKNELLERAKQVIKSIKNNTEKLEEIEYLQGENLEYISIETNKTVDKSFLFGDTK